MLKLVKISLCGLAILNLFDAIITYYIVCQYGISAELNIISRCLLMINPIFFLCIKSILSLISFYVGVKLQDYRKWMVSVLVVTIAYIGVVGWNIYMLTI